MKHVMGKMLGVAMVLIVGLLLAAAVVPSDFTWRTVATKRVAVAYGTTSKVVSLPGLKAGNTVGCTFVGFGDLTDVAAAGAARTTQVAYQTTTTAITTQMPNSCWSTTDSLAILRWPAATSIAKRGSTLELHYIPGR